MHRQLVGLALGMVLLALAGCTGSAQTGLAVEEAWVRPSPVAAGNGAAYMRIENHTGQDDALVRASSDAAEMVELHESMAMEGDLMSMQPVERIDIPAGGSATLEPGGLHVMLIGLRDVLRAGDTITLTLTFENAGDITVEAPVKEQ